MKNKKILIILTIIITILGGTSYFIYHQIEKNKKQGTMEEYIPQEEISIEGLRQTVVSLYFNQKDTNTLIPEARSIDVKDLTKNPYYTLMNLLLEGPKSDKLEKVIPDGTKINKIELKNNILQIDLSDEFIQNHEGGAQKESRTIYSIVNTLTQLNEVEGIKILINGKEDASFKDNAIGLKDIFVKEESIT